MSLRFAVVSNIGDNMARILDGEVTAMSNALRGAVDRSSLALQEELRAQVTGAGLGAKLANAWRREAYPRGGRRTLRPAALVYSKATALHEAFDQGAVVLPRGGSFLLLPSAEAERLGATTSDVSRKGGGIPGGAKRRVSSLEEASRKLGAPIVSAIPSRGAPKRGSGGGGAERRGFILLAPTKRNRSNLVALYFASRDAQPVLLFTLVRQTRVPKRLNIAAAAAKAETAFAANVAAALASEP
jgi:hypothetical protein